MPLAIRCASWNLRYDITPDKVTVQESLAALKSPLHQPTSLYKDVDRERPWSERRIRVWQHLVDEQLDLVCFQETLHRQVSDMHELLGRTEWEWAGVGRDDGQKRGEYSPVFFRTERFELLSSETFWLSRKHDVPGSIYPGSGCVRMCTCVRLRVKGDPEGRILSVLSTHLDHSSEEQRQFGASMLLARARYEEDTQGAAVLLFGDFNSPPDGADSGAYRVMTGATPPLELEPKFAQKFAVPSSAPPFKLIDLRAVTKPAHVVGHFATYTDWTLPSSSGPHARIDFILGGSGKPWKSLRYKVGENLLDDGCYMSDHRPVIASVEI
ncbi:mannose-6-phosphatase [Auriculariales sp. MPI-PUGE-AT-0066]|nr:mannose-6-phosphatase [Auriculariales sp. MPI-PUGE-AT-0066]